MSSNHGNEQLLRIREGGKRRGLQLDIQGYMLDCRVRNLAKNTIQIYQEQLGGFREWIGNKPAADVSTNDLRRYLLHLREEGRNPGGVHLVYRTLKTFFRWLVAEGELDECPMQRVRPPRVDDAPQDPVALDTVKAMVGTCDSRSFTDVRDRALLLFLLDTGARANETLAVNWGDCDIAGGAVMLRHTKNHRQRIVFLGVRARKALLGYVRQRQELEPASALWVGVHKRKRLSYWGLRQILRRRAEYAGVETPSAHDFRRAFCLVSLRNGMDVFSLQRLAGHADLSTTRRYVRQIKEDLRQAHEEHGPVDGML